MTNIFRLALRLNNLRPLLTPIRNNLSTNRASLQQQQLMRNLWYSTRNQQNNINTPCSCGCGSRRAAHTKAERELVEFLTEEILAERKAQKLKTIPTELNGFKAKLDGGEITLTKDVDNEKVQISFNVNHSVDTDSEPELHQNMDKPDVGELKSKPAFKVEIQRGDTTLSVMCSYVAPNEQDEGYNDVFGIDEISIYNGDWNENIYAVSGEVLDSYLYDLILNYLEEKGVSNEFVEKMGEYATIYEHSAYIGLLEGLSKFASGK